MNILLTGGAGFIGRHLARLLVDKGHRVTAMDTLNAQVHRDRELSRTEFPGPVLELDVADERSWSTLTPFDAVVHLAAETGTAQSMYEQDRYQDVNVTGTRLAARAAAEWGAPIVSLSSRAVYGEGPVAEDGRLLDSTEDDPHRPLSVYGETKSEAEDVLADEVNGAVPATVLRPQNVVGPGQALHNPYTGVLAAFLARLREGKELTVYGDGTQTRDFVHVEDVARVIEWCLENPGEPASSPRVFNVGTGVRTTLEDLAQYAVAASPGPAVEIVHVDVKRAGDIDHACADITRLLSAGAPAPRWSAEEAIADFIRTSWTEPGARSDAWDKALDELAARGLTE